NADHRRGSIKKPANRIEVLLDVVARHRLDDHPGAIGLQRLPDVRGGADRIAHVVQTIEECHQVKIGFRKILCCSDLEPDVFDHSVYDRVGASGVDRGGVEVVTDE